jgi:uncharacterized protein involved in exopolysaccharide biosynthesis
VENKNEGDQFVNSKNSITILDVITVFLRNKKRILSITGIVCLISIILYFFVFDLIFFSSATIKSSSKSSGLLGSLESGIPDIGGLDDIGLGSGKSAKELATYEEILTSRRCIEDLITHFKLMNREQYRFMEDAVKDFKDNKLKINQEKLSGVLYVGVFDKDPVLAKEMVEYLLDKLDKINIELNVQNAKNNREFIEKRYFQARDDLSKSEDSLKHFQIIYGISPDLQIKAAAQSQFRLESELKAEEIKLDVLRKLLSPEQVEVKTQEAKINSIRDKISNIQNSTDLNDMLRLGNSPQILMSFLRYQREVEIQSKIVSFLLPVYEQAKIEEKRETPTIMVLDKPYIAEKKTKPKRLTMVIVFTFLGFVVSTLLYLFKYKVKKWNVILKTEMKKNLI